MYGLKPPWRVVVVVLAGLFSMAVGHAQEKPAASATNWTGFYLGADVSQDFASALYKRPFDTSLSDTSVGSFNQSTGVGGYFGFNYQIAPWAVVGVEASDTWLASNIREQGPTYDFLEYANSIVAVTGRAGVLASPDTLIYGKFGPAWIRVNGFQGFGGAINQTVSGVQGGVGIETMVTPHIAIRGEASYTGELQTLTVNTGSDRYSLSVLQLQLGAEYKFDAPGGWGTPTAVASSIPAPVWTGFEVGGFLSLNGDQEIYTDMNQGPTGPFARFAVGGGAFVGANYQIDKRYVVGLEASGNFEHAQFVNAAGTNGYYGPLFDFGTMENVWALTGRFGYLVSPSTLFYVKGGPALLETTSAFGYWNNVAPNTTGRRYLPGYQVGVGSETFLTSNVSLRIEALYANSVQSVKFNGSIDANEFALKPSVLTATTGLAVHF